MFYLHMCYYDTFKNALQILKIQTVAHSNLVWYYTDKSYFIV